MLSPRFTLGALALVLACAPKQPAPEAWFTVSTILGTSAVAIAWT
jgi:hypothetical protein